jgi:Chaperone of endosialidase
MLGAALLNITAAMATPVISTITTTYSSAGSPTTILIIGTGLCGSPCAKPTITISGKALTVGNYGVTSAAATLPIGTVDGEYKLVFTAGTTGSITQPLVLKSTTTVKVGTTTTLAPGSAATVRNTGTTTSPVLAFGIPQGVTGATGPAGPKGATGATGPQGPAGTGIFEDGLKNNTAGGLFSFSANSSGSNDVAFGSKALAANTTGGASTAVGAGALESNTTGQGNSAFGASALAFSTTGVSNSAFGTFALGAANNTGGNNNAFGSAALGYNATGSWNDAFGVAALGRNSTGTYNTAFGGWSMYHNTNGTANASFGYFAEYMTTGTGNTAVGYGTLSNATTGSFNTAVGSGAGGNIIAGSNNVDIANPGVSTDSGVIRIGAAGTQGSTYIAGITGVGVSGSAVIVSSTGQLGIVSSSRRYKEEIEPMGDASDRLFKLRPVTFRYKQTDANGSKPLQYGLIAEEVAEVFPELVIRNKDDQPESVAYHLLAGLLLNELQKEHIRVEAQERRISELEADAASQKHQSAELEQLRAEVAELRKLTAQLVSRGSNQLNAVTTFGDGSFHVKQ